MAAIRDTRFLQNGYPLFCRITPEAAAFFVEGTTEQEMKFSAQSKKEPLHIMRVKEDSLCLQQQ
jgi:hypothetical protein